MQQTDYQVRVDLYQGPMDLLLYLVRRQEVDLLKVRLTSIVEQFMEFLEVLQILDLDMIGDFIVMASSLVEIKSRMVLPQPEEEKPEEELVDEAGANLISQLLEYKKYKDAATALEDRAAEWQERYPRLSNDRPEAGKDPAADMIREVELWDLVAALSRILKGVIVEEETAIVYDDTPIAVWQQRIRERIKQQGRVQFSEFFEGENVQRRIVGIFLAILELVRHHGFRTDQPQLHGEIWIMPPRPGGQHNHSQKSGPDESQSLTMPDQALLFPGVDSQEGGRAVEDSDPAKDSATFEPTDEQEVEFSLNEFGETALRQLNVLQTDDLTNTSNEKPAGDSATDATSDATPNSEYPEPPDSAADQES